MKSLDTLISARRPSQCHRLVRCIFAISDTKGDQTQIQIIQLQRTAKKNALANAELSVLFANWQILQVSADSYNYLKKKKVLAYFYNFFLAKKSARYYASLREPGDKGLTQIT